MIVFKEEKKKLLYKFKHNNFVPEETAIINLREARASYRSLKVIS